MVYNTHTMKWEHESERNASFLSDYVVIAVILTWARGRSGVRGVSPIKTILADDYLEARKAAKSLSEYYDTLGVDYRIDIYESCEKQRRERT